MINFILFFLLGTTLNAQVEEPVTWETRVEFLSENRIILHFDASIEEKWHLYSQFSDNGGALPTEFIFNSKNKGYNLIGGVKESESITSYDNLFQMDLTFFNEMATFNQEIEIEDPNLTIINAEINYQACDDKLCIFRTENILFSLNGKNIQSSKEVNENSKRLTRALQLELSQKDYLINTTQKKDEISYLNLFFLGFIGGLLALLTPCVFPMIPLTVSYFLKKATSRSKGIFNALTYSLFIVLIYVLFSLPFHFLDFLNPEILNTLATNVTLNLIFFGIFVFFAFSFFGYYDLALPSKWGNRADEASSISGVVGIFFMALTLAIVSFSCTGPILGSLLASSITANDGAPQLTMGMLGFGFALGLPFGLFALFPNVLKAIPKSGGWLTTLKVVLGFLELALALKFLSNADLVAHWGLLKRETFIAIWMIISFALTLYLFGIIHFKNESKNSISRARLGFGFLSSFFTLFLLFGLFSKENKLKILSGFPPPEFYSLREKENDCPLGLDCYKDYESGLTAAINQNKPILLDFTGWACVNCRKMEENVWSDPDVYPLLRDQYIIISLYVDDRKELDQVDQFNFQYPNGRVKTINTVGKKWSTFQTINFKTASQPFYVQMTANGVLLNSPIQYSNTSEFKSWLDKGLDNLPSKATFLTFGN